MNKPPVCPFKSQHCFQEVVDGIPEGNLIQLSSGDHAACCQSWPAETADHFLLSENIPPQLGLILDQRHRPGGGIDFWSMKVTKASIVARRPSR